MDNYREKTAMAIKWFLDSPIRCSLEGGSIEAYHEAYDSNRDDYTILYCEITGYALSFLSSLYKIKKDEAYLESAKKAGDFLVRAQLKDGEAKGAIPWTVLEKGRPHHHYYTFDTAMCITGLADLFMATEDSTFLDSASMAADWLVNCAQNDDGSFNALYNAKDSRFDNELLCGEWSDSRGSLHIKHLIALLKLYKITQNEFYLKSARKLLNWSEKMQYENGSFMASEKVPFTFTHAHCYATEGLAYGLLYLKDEECGKRIVKSADWMLKNQNRDGSWFDYYGLPSIATRMLKTKNRCRTIRTAMKYADSNRLLRIKRTDATAQGTRILMLAHLIDNNDAYLRGAEKALGFISSMQSASNETGKKGGLCFSMLDLGVVKKRSVLYTSWSTLFSVSAMIYFDLIGSTNAPDCSRFIEGIY